MHRLSEHTLLMSDTCNAARCAKRLLGTMAIDAAVERIGKDRWEAMGEVERGEKCANYQGDCYQHLRNILIGALSDGATNHLKDELADSLEDFSSFDRMSTDAMDLIRAIYKELHKVCSSTVQYSTVQYSTVQYSTVQYSTVQYYYHIIPHREVSMLSVRGGSSTPGCASTTRLRSGCRWSVRAAGGRIYLSMAPYQSSSTASSSSSSCTRSSLCQALVTSLRSFCGAHSGTAL